MTAGSATPNTRPAATTRGTAPCEIRPSRRGWFDFDRASPNDTSVRLRPGRASMPLLATNSFRATASDEFASRIGIIGDLRFRCQNATFGAGILTVVGAAAGVSVTVVTLVFH